MASIQCKNVIAKDLDSLWDFLLDPATWVESFAPILNFHYESMPMQLQHGANYKFEVRRWKVAQDWIVECHRNDELHEISLVQKSGPFKTWYLKAKITEHGEGQVLLTEQLHYQLPLLFLGGLLDDLYLGKDMRELMDQHQNYILSKV